MTLANLAAYAVAATWLAAMVIWFYLAWSSRNSRQARYDRLAEREGRR